MDKRPNILFLFSDQHRGDWMPGNAQIGYNLHMPNLCSLMKVGTTFTCAVTPAPLCAPARACLASGRRYRNCRVYSNNENYDACLPTFYQALREAGYFVSGAGKFDLNKAELDWENGFHDILRRVGFNDARDNEGKIDAMLAADAGIPGPYGRMLADAGWLEAYCDDMRTRGNSDRITPLPDEVYADNWITEQSCKLFQRIPQGQPWFMQVNFSGPHNPWDITERMKNSMQGRRFPGAVDSCVDAEQDQGIRQNYAAMLENIDRNIGHLLEAVRQRGDWENTLVIYSADHGEMLGDRNLYGKSVPWQGSVHIPMVIDASRLGGKSGQVNGTPVELQDLAATIAEYSQADTSAFRESISLRPILEGKTEQLRQVAVSELLLTTQPDPLPMQAFTAITDGHYKSVAFSDGAGGLFDLKCDPLEQCNLQGEMAEKEKELKEKAREI